MADEAKRGSVLRANIRAAARGFSLMEVMIVIVIILLISGLVAVNLFGQRDRAMEQTAEVQLQSIKDALRFFYLEYNRYPTADEGIAVLWDKERLDADAEDTKWRKFMEEPKPTDPWGSQWGYTDESDEGHEFELWSYGPDKEDGTDDDINVWADAAGEGEGGDLPPPPPPAGG